LCFDVGVVGVKVNSISFGVQVITKVSSKVSHFSFEVVGSSKTLEVLGPEGSNLFDLLDLCVELFDSLSNCFESVLGFFGYFDLGRLFDFRLQRRLLAL